MNDRRRIDFGLLLLDSVIRWLLSKLAQVVLKITQLHIKSSPTANKHLKKVAKGSKKLPKKNTWPNLISLLSVSQQIGRAQNDDPIEMPDRQIYIFTKFWENFHQKQNVKCFFSIAAQVMLLKTYIGLVGYSLTSSLWFEPTMSSVLTHFQGLLG